MSDKKTATCSECEFFGDYVGMLFSEEWKTHVEPNGVVGYYHPFIGFDEKQGAGCTYDKDTWHKRMRIYDNSPVCGCFKPRTWTRPEDCVNCSRCHGQMSDGSYLCDGYPFYKKDGKEPCQNGRAQFEEQLKLF